MQLTDELIEGAVNNITGFIVARAAKEYNLPTDETMRRFLISKTGTLLADKNTGMYWDSLEETYEMFTRELRDEGVRYA